MFPPRDTGSVGDDVALLLFVLPTKKRREKRWFKNRGEWNNREESMRMAEIINGKCRHLLRNYKKKKKNSL